MSENWSKRSEKKWDETAKDWNESSRTMWDNGSRKDIIPFFTQHIKSPCEVLDVGCGDGYGSQKLMEQGFKVHGVDLSHEMIKIARNRKGVNLSFQQANMMDLPYENQQFDALMVINAIEWTEHPLAALKELKRVVKVGGFLLIGILGPTAHPRTYSFPRLHNEESICNTMMPWEFERLALENNWTVVDGKGVYRKGVSNQNFDSLPNDLKQALSFMWLYMLKRKG
ncbi:class I SAM-dependent methyltransferase [Bacillus carboniphilus]|uniref:Class I SAM-dependent methyltransferase n=1 Tax=Bacillus carboniphilus TaxID=86663 RepID=A0ABY9K197_9BACI|nr:class I SAM-dependent methyltransferase [Bacillus carboniphilus]WLR43681.1 class I SAM-dependent methyltransferase [Bacillus carboniphilus]